MKVVILAGGFGTRLSEETVSKPKPMVEIGGRPILWHIMKIYESYGYNEFIICLGYKGYYIKEYFANYLLHESDMTCDFRSNEIKYFNNRSENWKVTLVDTGLDTMTGGRIKRIKDYVNNETFMLTYGDGVGNVDIQKLHESHKKNGNIATLTATKPFGRFGALKLDETMVIDFEEKPEENVSWINGGFFVLEPEIFDMIEGDSTIFEREPLESLTKSNELHAFKHHGFWRAMDTLRDKNTLNKLWNENNPPWKTW